MTPHAPSSIQRADSRSRRTSRREVEVNGFKSSNAIANCIEVDAAEVTAPNKVDEKAHREVGSSQVQVN